MTEPSSPDIERLRQVLGAFYKTVDVMKSARNQKVSMPIWADDMKATEDVVLFLENLRDAPVRSSAGNVEAGDDCACGGGNISGHDAMCPERSADEAARTLDPIAWLDIRTAGLSGGNRLVATNPQYVENNGPENFAPLYLDVAQPEQVTDEQIAIAGLNKDWNDLKDALEQARAYIDHDVETMAPGWRTAKAIVDLIDGVLTIPSTPSAAPLSSQERNTP